MSLPKSIKKSDHVLPLPSPPKKNENSKAEVCAPKRSREERGSLEDPSDPSLPFSFQRRGKSANPPRVSRLHCDRTKPKRLGGGGGRVGVISFSYGIFLAQKHHGELDKNIHFGPSSRWKSGLKLGNLTIFTWMYTFKDGKTPKRKASCEIETMTMFPNYLCIPGLLLLTSPKKTAV